MEMIKRFEPVALLFMVIGALNWGMVGLFEENVIANVFGTDTFTDVLYVIDGRGNGASLAINRLLKAGARVSWLGAAMAPPVKFLTERGIPVVGHVGIIIRGKAHLQPVRWPG